LSQLSPATVSWPQKGGTGLQQPHQTAQALAGVTARTQTEPPAASRQVFSRELPPRRVRSLPPERSQGSARSRQETSRLGLGAKRCASPPAGGLATPGTSRLPGQNPMAQVTTLLVTAASPKVSR